MPWNDLGRSLEATGEPVTPRLRQHRGPSPARIPASPSSRVNELQRWSLERTPCPHSSAQGRECQLLSRRQGLAFLPDAAPKECQPRGTGDRAPLAAGGRGETGSTRRKAFPELAEPGRAEHMCAAAVCLLNTAPGHREWLEFTPRSPPDPKDTQADRGNSLLQPVAMAAYFRDSSSEKNKRRKPKHFNGRGKKMQKSNERDERVQEMY